MEKVLMVDDDPVVLEDNRRYFESKGYEVLCVQTAEEAERLISTAALSCVVLDVKLPGMNGFTLCERVRERTGVPVVFLSCYTEEESRVRGLIIGGDDYICKPYSLQELELRVRARIRAGMSASVPSALSFGALTINPGNRTVVYAGRPAADFSTYEFEVLYFLAKHPREVFSYEQIFNHVWQAPSNKGLKALQMIIVRIRQKLADLCPEHEYIQTIRRKGYLFVPQSPEASCK